MAADPTAFRVMRGSDIITNSCLFYGNDRVTQLDGNYSDGYFWPNYFNFVVTIYVEYEGIKYGWSNYNFGSLNSADLSELEGPAILDRVELPDGSQALIQDSRISEIDTPLTSSEIQAIWDSVMNPNPQTL